MAAIGWRANTAALNLADAGVECDPRGFVRTDGQQRTSAPHIFAAGDVAGGLMLVPQALQGIQRRAKPEVSEANRPQLFEDPVADLGGVMVVPTER